MLHAIITTVQQPTDCVKRLAETLVPTEARLIVAGDTKGPKDFDLSEVAGFHGRTTFLSIEDQLNLGFSIAPLLPTKHYCRKNVAYLEAIRSGATCIYETDDDNAPLDSWRIRSEWINRPRFVRVEEDQFPAWVNVYRHFTGEMIWPRGLPLDRIHESSATSDVPPERLGLPAEGSEQYWAPIQQGLANGAPDVDAVWRLVLDREFVFEDQSSVTLGPGQWCPFNTQTTWWWPAVYPLLYIPSYCPFRMCDIWKSFVAQRCLWELGTGLVFHAAEVVQERNPHHLMSDFADEVPGYLGNHRIATVLESLSLKPGVSEVGENLRACYEILIAEGIFPKEELALVDAWTHDVDLAIHQATLCGQVS